MMYNIYIIYSNHIDHYYVGYTVDSLDERLRKHNTNYKGYTAKTNDWVLLYTETFISKTEAYSRERQIKRQKSRIYIENLIRSAG